MSPSQHTLDPALVELAQEIDAREERDLFRSSTEDLIRGLSDGSAALRPGLSRGSLALRQVMHAHREAAAYTLYRAAVVQLLRPRADRWSMHSRAGTAPPEARPMLSGRPDTLCGQDSSLLLRALNQSAFSPEETRSLLVASLRLLPRHSTETHLAEAFDCVGQRRAARLLIGHVESEAARDDLYVTAIRNHAGFEWRVGRFSEALAGYRQVGEADPGARDVLLYGLALSWVERRGDAASWFEERLAGGLDEADARSKAALRDLALLPFDPVDPDGLRTAIEDRIQSPHVTQRAVAQAMLENPSIKMEQRNA